MIAAFLNSVKAALGGQDPASERTARADDVDLTEVDARVAGWLPYSAYRPQDQVFVNRDSLGFCLELTPQTGANQDTAERLKGLYARLPSDATLQVHLVASPNVGPTLKRYASLRRLDDDATEQAAKYGGRPARNKNVFRQMARRRYAHLLRGSKHPLAPDVTFLVRDFRIFLSVTLPGHITDLARLDQLLDTRESMRSTLQAAQFPSVVMDAKALIELVGELLNPARLRGTATTPVAYDDMKLLSEQIIDRETTGDWSDPTKVLMERIGGTEEERVELRFLSVQRTPKTFALWGMSSLVGDLFQDSLQVPCPFMITMGVSVPDQQSMATSAVADKVQAERNAKGDLATYSPGLLEANEHWSNALKALAGGGKLVWAYHQVVLFARPGKGPSAESALRDLWRARGFELVVDGFIHRVALLQSLPMGLSKTFVGDLMKLRRMELRTSGNTIHLAPLVAEGKGTGTPTMLGVGRRGQLITLDFFDNTQAGKNVSIAGGVGAGKSTLLQVIAEAYASRGALVRVFEAGRSFERMCGLLGGQFLPFTRRSRVCVNPMSMVSKPVEIDGELYGGIDDDIALLQPLLAKMASPSAPLEPSIYASLALVIKEEYQRHGPATTITHIRDRYAKGWLHDEPEMADASGLAGEPGDRATERQAERQAEREKDQRYTDMAVMLSPFCAEGAYADYFEGPSTLDFGNDFLVFEMQELQANPHLYTVIQMILLYRVSREFLEDRHRQKVFILDEAKDVLAGSGNDDKAMGEFVERLYLRVRKCNGTAITASQDVAHWFSSPHGASIWNQSEYIVLGRQSENSIEAIARGEAIRLDEPLRRLLTSITSTTSSFREWYVHSGAYKGVMRLVLDPATLLLMSNRAEDNVPLDAAIGRGLSVGEAIDEVLRQRGVEEAR